MAHLILEYSANLDAGRLDLGGLLAKLVQAAVDTGLFPLAGIRARALRCEHFHVADGNPEYGFVHLQFKIGTGRTDDEQELAANTIFDALSAHLQPLFDQQGLAISFEMGELPAVLKFNKNNLREHLAEK